MTTKDEDILEENNLNIVHIVIIISIGLFIFFFSKNIWMSFSITLVLLIIYIVIMRGMKSEVIETEKMHPPKDWMIYSGSKCPDYWEYKEQKTNPTGTLKGTYNVCYNNPSTNLSVDVPDTNDCYDDKTGRLKYFPVFTSWPPTSEQDLQAKKNICNWMNKCGPTMKSNLYGKMLKGTVPASWQGMKC